MTPDLISDEERYPTLSEEGRKMLQWLREHPHAPIYRNQSGNRLTSSDVEQVRSFEKEVSQVEEVQSPGLSAVWLDAFLERCFSEVPFYRRYGARPRTFENI